MKLFRDLNLTGFVTKVWLLAIIVSSTGCASILNSKYQKVSITSGKKTTLLVDGAEPTKKDGQYLLVRDHNPRQLTIKKEGYKDRKMVVMQHKRSPLVIMSWIPFGIVYLLPPLLDRGPKSFDYDKVIDVSGDMVSLPKKDSLAKEIRINSVSVKMDKENMKYRFFPTYKSFVRNAETEETHEVKNSEKIELENTVFSSLLNEMLKTKGYIDTTVTKKVFGKSFTSNLSLDATITDYTIHHINNKGYGGMVYMDLTIKWEALDYYKKPVYTMVTEGTSGQYAMVNFTEKDEIVYESIKDAMEDNLIKFMTTPEVTKLLHDDTEQKMEQNYEDIVIASPPVYASTLAEAIKACVTIKTKDGHGSGFIVSNDGYIITNYHVVSDTADLKVIMNDMTEHKLKVVRISKVSDLALVKIDIEHSAPLKINESKNIEIATDIYAVGTPTSEDLSQTISKGIISGIRTVDAGAKLIQTDASINGGNSGGAIVTKEGLVLGVVSSKLTGFGIEGVAFGIPAYEVYDRLKVKFQ